MDKTYQLFKPVFHKEEIFKLMGECLDKGWTGLGNLTNVFEDKWKEYTGLPYAHYVNSATVGLHLAFNILKKQNSWQDNDEIITTSITFVSTNMAIVYENLKPVFADVLEDGTLDPQDIIKKITPKTRAICFVGLGGNISKFNEILKIAKEHNLKVILDAAHMAGSRVNGEVIGKEADCIVYSFQAVKNLPTADSGMICFKEEANDKLVRQLSWLGIDKDTFQRTTTKGAYKWQYDVPNVGFKYHGNSIMAAMGIVELKYLDQANAFRRTVASWYMDNLKDSNIKYIKHDNEAESSRHLFQILIPNRNEVLMALNEYNIYPGVHYQSNIMYKPFYVDYELPRTSAFSESTLSLPLHLELTKNDVDFISNSLKKIVKKP